MTTIQRGLSERKSTGDDLEESSASSYRRHSRLHEEPRTNEEDMKVMAGVYDKTERE